MNKQCLRRVEQFIQETCWSEPPFYLGVYRVCAEGYQRSLDHTGLDGERGAPCKTAKKSHTRPTEKIEKTVFRILKWRKRYQEIHQCCGIHH